MPVPTYLSALPLLASLASAHFKLNYPAARGFDEDILGTFPCGGQDTVSADRTQWPLTGGPIQLDLGHTSTNIQVLIAIGNEPGDAFNTVLVPTFAEQGPENFCLGQVFVPSTIGGVSIASGTNATIQVVTNGDPDGGLYNCADITFTSTPLTADEYSADCKNSSGIATRPLSNAGNANGTTDAAPSGSSVSAGSTPSSTGAAVPFATAGSAALFLGAVGAFGVLAL